ncbi:Uncharacterised protein [Acinetobacter phage MD-2021a]|nr:Uncharacterised protein [Acinetobacter phage MD-2021a]CAH1088997.1 Uncharacterised protein [Acinetobacter phage MD-2021a]
MELALLIWFASVSTGIAKLFGTISFVTFVTAAFVLGFSLFYSFVEDEKLKIFEYKKSIIGVFIFSLVSGLISVVIPDERTVYLMASGYAGQKIVESDKFQKSTNDVYEIVNMKLEQIKRDMQEDLDDVNKTEGEKK